MVYDFKNILIKQDIVLNHFLTSCAKKNKNKEERENIKYLLYKLCGIIMTFVNMYEKLVTLQSVAVGQSYKLSRDRSN